MIKIVILKYVCFVRLISQEQVKNIRKFIDKAIDQTREETIREGFIK